MYDSKEFDWRLITSYSFEMQTSRDDLAQIEQTWSELSSDWESDQAHKRFIALCLSLGRLDLAGGHYREIGEADPTKRAEAERRIAAIIAAGTEILYSQRSEKPRGQPRLFLIALGVSLSMIGYSLWLLYRQWFL
ncbi:MAG: hypothetical protein JXA30_01420 [Deltaproteobacteria bacterium]|nr:hypothetical protein [Deltaproteobacteria bacterium]